MQGIIEKYQVRKRKFQKTEFIKYLIERLKKSGYTNKDIKIEERWKSIFNTRNIVIGNPDTANIYITAHYDTQAVAPFPNFMIPTNVFMFIVSQIFMCILVLLFTWILTIPVAIMSSNVLVYEWSYEIVLLILVFWMLIGWENKHTANDNTSGTITLIKILENLPKQYRNKVCIVFFDNEEKGLFGSLFFSKLHPHAQTCMLINIDCVGDGNHLISLFPKSLQKNDEYQKLEKCFGKISKEKNMIYHSNKMKPMMFGSDQMHFDKGVGICTLKKSKLGFLYCDKIHTPFDNMCQENNLDCISQSIINFIERSE